MGKGVCSFCPRDLLACLLGLVFLAYSSAAFAAHEVTDYTADSPPESPTALQWTDDVTVQWESPAMGNDTLIEFAYLWSTSATPLTYTEYDVQNYDGAVGAAETPYNAILSSTDTANDDSDVLRYLHIQTVYFPEGSPGVFTLSDDTVIGPFNIDNVVSGTLCLPNPDCNNPLVSTRQTQVTITAGVPADLATNGLYLADGVAGGAVPQRPSQGVAGDTTTYTLQNDTPGNKTIYAWFMDQAGNISTPSTADFTLLNPVSIDPDTATIDPRITDLKDFTVSGTAAGYDWAIINEKDAQGAAATPGTIAQITTDDTDQNGVTVQGLAEGFFQLQATPTAAGDVLTSGTITVLPAYARGDADGNGTIDSTDALYVLHNVAGNIPESQLLGDCDVDNSGTIDSTDALYILHYVAGNIGTL
jgi:hypothetical protein